jgi:hypothetical protein
MVDWPLALRAVQKQNVMQVVCTKGSPHFLSRSKREEEELVRVLISPLKAQP